MYLGIEGKNHKKKKKKNEKKIDLTKDRTSSKKNMFL